MENLQKIQLDFGFTCEPIIDHNKPKKTEKQSETDLVLDLMDFIKSPIIVFKSAWQDAIPTEMLKKIPLARMMSMMNQEKMASLTEVVVYMMPRTFEAPLPSEWTNIYTWAGLQYAKTFKQEGQVEAMKEIAPEKLSDYEMELLNKLRKWIYNERRKVLKAFLKNETNLKSKKNIMEQIGLFSD